MKIIHTLNALDYASESELHLIISALPLSDDYLKALLEASKGTPRLLNEKLFNLALTSEEPIIWLAPLPCSPGRFAWFYGTQHPKSSLAQMSLNKGEDVFLSRNPVEIRSNTPPILFYNPIASSELAYVLDGDEDEFGIFQDDLTTENIHRSKRLILNIPQLVEDRSEAITRAESVFSDVNFSYLRKNLDFLILLHSEGHNRGHFHGPWPLDQDKAAIQEYEPLEELRSCLQALQLAQDARLDDSLLDALALCILVTRFFGYGYSAYHADQSLPESFREVSAGVILWEWLVRKKVIQFDNSTESLSAKLSYPELRHAILELLVQIHDYESTARLQGVDSLSYYAGIWFELAYPDACYSPEVLSIYSKGGD